MNQKKIIASPVAAMFAIVLCLSLALHGQAARKPQKKTAPAPSLLERHYRLGETLSYVMKGVNEGGRYEAHAKAVVKRDAEGGLYEEYTWTSLKMNGADVALPAGDFRQDVSLALDYN